MKKSVLTILLTGVIWAPALGDYEPVDVPLRQVVLFSSGVGYFQHGRTVKGDAAATLMFKTDQINDVLKSMVLMDFDGGMDNHSLLLAVDAIHPRDYKERVHLGL